MKTLVDKFLSWPLPATVCADTCATTTSYPHPRTGTNLLNATEAEAMLKHVVGVVLDERDALRAAIESWKKEEQSWQDDMKDLRAALKQYTDGDECSVDGAPDANNANHGETCRYCKAMSLLGWPGFER